MAGGSKSLFTAMTANDVIEEVKSISNPRQLFGPYWYENEVCCLFADENVGKSILAVQICDDITHLIQPDENVLYYDFELSKKQFENRYRSDDGKEHYVFQDNFIRVELNADNIPPERMNDIEDLLIEGIEENAVQYKAKAIVVDNISWLINLKNSVASAGKLMRKLCNLKKQYGLSILVLAHNIKRNRAKGIENNNMNGSKKMSNFFDAMFTIGMCQSDPSFKYIMQTKVRTGEFTHDKKNVDVCKIEKVGPNLKFVKYGNASEDEMLGKETPEFGQKDEKQTEAIKEAVKEQPVKQETSTKKEEKPQRSKRAPGSRSELVEKQLNRMQEYWKMKYVPTKILK